MHNVYVIYKQILDNRGNIESVSVVEVDADESMAVRYTKFHSTQVPHDLRKRVQFYQQAVRVV